VLVGVVNNSGATVFGISLTGDDIFGFDFDGAATYTGTSFGPTGYEGPGTSFSPIDASSGTVNFDNGLPNQGFIWFSLEGAPSQVRLSQRVTIDPGHGSNCGAVNQAVGAVGETDYPVSDPPPGRLHEDVLAVNVATALNGRLQGNGFDVHLTKTDSVSCPTLLERTAIANKAKSNMFVSIHFNAPRFNFFGIGSGSLGIYNSAKTSAQQFADLTAPAVASAVGVSNRGSRADDTLAVLKTTTSRMTAIIIEVGRLSAPDEDVLHKPVSSTFAAGGIAAGINAFLNQ
jgi:N-acetylmuramoyl-L-alanine amidase